MGKPQVQPLIQSLIDQLLSWAAGAIGNEDIVLAKHEYFARTGGEVHEDDRSFEQRMQGFFNWYLFDRRVRTGRGELSPAQQFLNERATHLSDPERDLVAGGTQSRLSIYEYLGHRSLLRRVPPGMVRVRDVITRDDFDVLEQRQMLGLDAGDLFEARLIPVASKWHFSSSFIFHPRDARRPILKELKKRRKALALADPRAFCWEVSRMALQTERFRNVALSAIYNFETPFLGNKRLRSQPGAHPPGESAQPGDAARTPEKPGPGGAG
jgi:hypothetical protein